MSEEFLPTTDELLARMDAAVLANEYAIVRLSARRFAVAKRQVKLDRRLAGYGRITPRGGGQLGYLLEDPIYLRDWVEMEIVEGYDKLTYEMALRGLYLLTHPEP